MKCFYFQFLLTFLILMVGENVFAQSYFELDGIYYGLYRDDDGNHVAGVIHPNNPIDYISGDITIPNAVNIYGNTYPVKGLYSYAFYGCSSLTSVSIPESVTTIGKMAFYGCSGLTSVTIRDGLTAIGDSAFCNCSNLKNIDPPESVTSIGYNAFYATPWFSNQPNGVIYVGRVAMAYKGPMPINTTIVIKEGTIGIGSEAFEGYTNLKSIILPESITNIGSDAFSGCTGLTSIVIPKSVKSIGSHAFENCRWLTSVQITDLAAWCQIDFEDYYSNPLFYARHLFLNNTEITDIVIPESVTTISNNVFPRCSSLKSIYIPESVTSIGDYAFPGCTSLTSINIPYRVTAIGEQAFASCRALTSITIPESVTTIGDGAFDNCSGLTSINIPESVTSIGYATFGGCIGLTYVNIPESVITIGDYAFSSCSGLTSITIPNSVTTIGEYAFEDCTGLSSITIYGNVVNFGYGLFKGCSNLTTATMHCPHVYSPWFSNNAAGFKEIILGEEVISIGDKAFSGCSGLTSITIPNSVTSIGGHAFSGCSGLTSVNIGKGVKDIGKNAFDGCSKLKSVNTADAYTWCSINFGNEMANPLYYANALYQDDKRITDLVIPYETERISPYAFYNCTSLNSVVIPNTVTSIGENAFQGCDWLQYVVSLIDIPFAINDNTFPENKYKSHTLYVPNGTETTYKETKGWKKFENIEPTDTKFTLTYFLEGKEYKVYEIQATEAVIPEPDPVKDGFTFSGWSDIPPYMPVGNVVIIGYFTPVDGIVDTQAVDYDTKDRSYYSINGQRLITPKKGINIIRSSDGTTHKVLIK